MVPTKRENTMTLRSKFMCIALVAILNVVLVILVYSTVQNHSSFPKFSHIHIPNSISKTFIDFIRRDTAAAVTVSAFNFSDNNIKDIPPQKCKIPKLNPNHPDVLPHINYSHKKRCTHKSVATIEEGGMLKLIDTAGVTSAKFAYIRRVSDSKNTKSDWITLYPIASEEGVKLTEDFVKVIITKSGHDYTEYHMYPVRTDAKKKTDKPKEVDASKLNIVMLMIDSLSHCGAQRYLKKTYKMLEEDEDTVILNGHTIVGDGTTAQICAMFIGQLEHELPEARRGYAKAGNVDRWPFIYQQFHDAGYKTLYSEDSPSVNTFNYRLKGFSKSPTTKYIRPFWIAASSYINQLVSNSAACLHGLAIQYLKNFLEEYQDTPTFSFLAFSELAHDSNSRSQLADPDYVEFFDYMKKNNRRNDTIVILFGDHGDRSSAFRATMHGKLEERLPLMTFSFPRWFKQKYPREFYNFHRSAHVLTSHFDIYSTFKHLLTFPENKYQDKRGKSLFTDIASMNRTCSEVGVAEHWCTCLDYEVLSVNDTKVIASANALVDFINKKNADVDGAKGQCETLKLQNVVRATKVIANNKVQKFSETFRNGKCDECGVKESKQTYKTTNIELVVSVSPSNGEYEGIAIYHEETKKITVSKEISRLNKYGDQPHCVAKLFPYLRNFCYCKTQLSSKLS